MNKYICTICGKACYSAAELEHLYDDRCPYCKAKIKPETKDTQVPNIASVAKTTLHSGII